MGKAISYYIFLGFTGLIKIHPFWLLYRFSDFLFFMMYYVVRYRKWVVIKNMKKCFPDKSDRELSVYHRKFYQSLCDMFVETIKGFTLGKKALLKRFVATNPEVADKYFKQGKDVIILLGHFANWEWAVATLYEKFLHQPVVLYKPISNPYIDKYFNKSRSRFGIQLVSIRDTKEFFIMHKPKPVAVYMIADQFPPVKERQKEVVFFNSVTPFLHGPEKYATMLNIPVLFLDLKRVNRGYYQFSLTELSPEPQNLPENELTQRYASLLQKSISDQPESWVWSHKRWKRELY